MTSTATALAGMDEEKRCWYAHVPFERSDRYQRIFAIEARISAIEAITRETFEVCVGIVSPFSFAVFFIILTDCFVFHRLITSYSEIIEANISVRG
jgi:hypothetical protein